MYAQSSLQIIMTKKIWLLQEISYYSFTNEKINGPLLKEKKKGIIFNLPNRIIRKVERTSKECLQTPYLVLGEEISDFLRSQEGIKFRLRAFNILENASRWKIIRYNNHFFRNLSGFYEKTLVKLSTIWKVKWPP